MVLLVMIIIIVNAVLDNNIMITIFGYVLYSGLNLATVLVESEKILSADLSVCIE